MKYILLWESFEYIGSRMVLESVKNILCMKSTKYFTGIFYGIFLEKLFLVIWEPTYMFENLTPKNPLPTDNGPNHTFHNTPYTSAT